MKTKALLLLLIGILATTGSTCVQDGFLVSVNVPIKAVFAINPGDTLVFDRTQVIKLKDLIDQSYVENLKNVRYFDVRIGTQGSYNSNVFVIGSIDGVELVRSKTSASPWDSLATPQSLLSGSSRFTFQTPGLNQLMTKLNQFKTNSETSITLSASGNLSGPKPVPSGLAIVVEIYAQADSEVK